MARENIWYALEDASKNASHRTEVLSRTKLRKLWSAIVRMFTARHLTVTSDRLIALAGIAKVIGKGLHDEYCAGLWRRSLALDLCWSHQNTPRLRPRPTIYRAPSWSWASLDGECILGFADENESTQPLIMIIQYCGDTSTNDPFGCVKAATLTLNGWLAEQSKLHYFHPALQFISTQLIGSIYSFIPKLISPKYIEVNH